MSVDLIELWHQRARPAPTTKDFNVQLGCHFEEFVEMLECLHFEHPKFGASCGGDLTVFTLLYEMADELKANRIKATVVDRRGFLDSIADQVVTGVGVGHCAKLKTTEAVRRVNTSNWSKYDHEGKPIFDQNGKITKGPNYEPPDLEGLY